ncbi:AMP-binding protein [Nocardia sp. NPDC050710]|uniref:AMP-binding protein n=1 Tax=Nocardia sp. NPDC050710 TaxID=3157220 RepID=UPI0033EF1AD2
MPTDLPLTAAQHGIAVAQKLWPRDGLFILAESVTLTGAIDAQRWADAVRAMITDTEAQRIRLHDNGTELVQRICPADLVPVIVTDLTAEPDPAEAAEAIMRADQDAPCDPYAGVTTAHRILALAPDRVVWYHRAHHISLDGYGFAQCARRVAEHYRGLTEATTPPPAHSGLADVVAEDLAYPESGAHAEAAAYWHRTLSPRSAPTLTGTPATPSARTLRARRGLTRWAPPAGVRYGAAESVLAAVAIYLARRTGEAEVVLGVPMMNRLGSVAASVPAMVLNAVALPVRVDPAETVAELAARIGATLRRSRKHARYRHERLRADLGLLGGGRTLLGPVVNIMPFDYDLGLPGIEVRADNRGAGPVEDLSVNLYLRNGTAELAIDANPRSYTRDELAGHADGLTRAVETAAAEPDRRIGDFAMTYRLIQRPESTPAPHPLARWFAHVSADPDAPALTGGGPYARSSQELGGQRRSHPEAPAAGPMLTRGELHTLAAERAADLRAGGAGPGGLVAVLPSGGATDIVTVLAAHLAGAAHAVLDRSRPVGEIRSVLDDLGAAILIHGAGDEVLAAELGDGTTLMPVPDRIVPMPVRAPGPVPPSDAGYAVFTSGTTGRPKAVRVGGGALAAFVDDAVIRYGWTTGDRVLQYGPLHADTSIEEIFVTLAAGACLVLAEGARTPSELCAVADNQSVTVLDLPTAVWHELVGAVDAGALALPGSVRQVILGGEEASAESVTRWRRGGGPVLHNSYGPSEAAVVCASIDLTGEDLTGVSLGTLFPRAGAVLAIDGLAPADATVPAGVLHLYGPMLADGYLPAGASAGFREITIGTETVRAFVTGDRMRLRADGVLEFDGRVDGVVKIGGARIAVGTIEDLLRRCQGVGDALVTRHGEYALAALVTVTGERPAAWFDDLRTELAGQLPAAWVPARITAVDTLPRTRNLKADRRATRSTSTGDIGAGDIGTETVRRILAEVLGRTDLDPAADFFAAGGTSMQILALAGRLTAATGRPVTVDDILSAPTAESLAARLSLAPARPSPGPDLADEIAALRSGLAGAPVPVSPSRRVLLTGATGFLGAYLLTETLRVTDRDIVAVVRADTLAAARSRLRVGCAAIGAAAAFDRAWDTGRLRVLLGDCATDDLAGRPELAGGIGHILHSAAQISAVRSYASLREVNVVAAHGLLRLARTHGAAMILVSTATAAGHGGDLADPATLPTGYAQTKSVAEHLLATATREFGVPTTVVRLGRVLPTPGDERGAAADFLHDLTAAVVAVGSLPRTTLAEPMTRADHLAAVIVGVLDEEPTATPRVLDPFGPGPVAVADVLAAATRGGLTTEPIAGWRDLVAADAGLTTAQRIAVLRWCDIQLAGFARDWTSHRSVQVPGVTPAEAARLLGLGAAPG